MASPRVRAATSLFLFIVTLVPSDMMYHQVGSTKPSMLRQKLLSVVSADFALLLYHRERFEYVCKGTKFDESVQDKKMVQT